MSALASVIRARARREVGPPFRPGPPEVVLAYPSAYRAGMSSLGYQVVLARLRAAGIAAERCFLPDDVAGHERSRTPPMSEESLTPLGRFRVIGVSLAYELELAGLITLLRLAGIPPLRRDRGPDHPRILLGGPLTFSNPLPAAPFVDAMLIGGADGTCVPAFQAAFDDREAWLDAVAALPGGYVPERHGEALPPVAQADDALLPAASCILTPDTELSSMFLIEGERGCHRTCTFCVMRRSTNGGMRRVPAETLIERVPADVHKVGLVGAAISDHPELVPLLEALVGRGHQVSLSSLRADRIARKPRIAELLRQSGARSLTVASDAASERLRKDIEKGTTEAHLRACADVARELRFETLKVYMMLGVPGETDDDVDELVRFSLELSARTRVSLGVAPFVAKRNTPLDGVPFAGIKLVDSRLRRLTRGLRGRVEVKPTSARWAWVEWCLAQGGWAAGEAALAAVDAGGRFSDWQAAFRVVEEVA